MAVHSTGNGHRMNINLTPDQRAKLEVLAATNDASMSAVIGRLIDAAYEEIEAAMDEATKEAGNG